MVAHAPALRARDILRRFWPDVRPYRRWIASGSSSRSSSRPSTRPRSGCSSSSWTTCSSRAISARCAGSPLTYLGLLLLGAAIGFADDYIAAWVGERFTLNMRTRVFGHVQRLSAGDLDRRRSATSSAACRATSPRSSFVAVRASRAPSAVLRIIFFAGALFYLDWVLALISLVMAPLFLFTARSFSRLVKGAAREKRRRSGSLSAVTEESLANSSLIQSYNRQDVEVERFRREGEGIVQAELASTRIRALFTPVIDLLELLGRAARDRLGTVAVAEGRPVGGRAARVPRLPHPALRPGARPQLAGQLGLRGRRGRRARDRAAGRAAACRRPPGRTGDRPGPRPRRAGRRDLPLPRRRPARARGREPARRARRDGRAGRA